jgi:Na+/melibiose symporter-like transporter
MEKNDLLLEEWKMASELHRHMDNMAWQSLNFFMATNGALLAILGAVIISDKFTQDDLLPLVIAAAISVVGMIISLLWAFIQIRQQLYQYYRVAQAKRVEENLKIAGDRVLTLYEKNLNEQDLIAVPKFRRYLESRAGKWRSHSLVVVLGFSLAIVWFLSFLFFVGYAIFK